MRTEQSNRTKIWVDTTYAMGNAALANIGEIPTEGPKYSSGSSIYTDQSIINPNSNELLYCIASIIQSEIFEQLSEARKVQHLHLELVMPTTLPAHLGGPVEIMSMDVVNRETVGDPELRDEILANRVPTVDTILRFISWVFQSAKYTAQCNVIAFVYVKRIMTAHRLLSFHNWRGIWMGAILIAQKIVDDVSVKTSSFCSILPGVEKAQLKAIELKVFSLMNFSGHVKPSVFALYYFEIRKIFHAITGQLAALRKAKGPAYHPLSRAQGEALLRAPSVPTKTPPATVDAPIPAAAASQKGKLREGGELSRADPEGTNPGAGTRPPTGAAGWDRAPGGPVAASRTAQAQQQPQKPAQPAPQSNIIASSASVPKLPVLQTHAVRGGAVKARSLTVEDMAAARSRSIWVLN